MAEPDVGPPGEALRDRLRAEDDPWIGYLVVRHAQPAPWGRLIARVAEGLCRLRDADAGSPALAAWEAGPFRKVCLRAKEGEWRRLREGLVDAGLDVVLDDALLVLEPRRRSTAVEQGLGRLQVCRWTHDDLPDAGSVPAGTGRAATRSPSPPVLGVLDRGEMGVGKQLAQAAHAAQLAHLEATPAERAAWAATGYAVLPRSCSAADLAAIAAAPGAAAIHDAGLTEVAPGTLTAVLAPGGRPSP